MISSKQSAILEGMRYGRGTDRLYSAMVLLFIFAGLLDGLVAILTPWGNLGMWIFFPTFTLMLIMNNGGWANWGRVWRTVVLNLRSTAIAVDMDNDMAAVRLWTKENCRFPSLHYREGIWRFWSKNDAMMFKLMWGGHGG